MSKINLSKLMVLLQGLNAPNVAKRWMEKSLRRKSKRVMSTTAVMKAAKAPLNPILCCLESSYLGSSLLKARLSRQLI